MDPQKRFSRIYNQRVEEIYRFIFLKVESKETAEDLTAEVFRRGWLSFRRGLDPKSSQEEIKQPRAFLYHLARYTVVDYYRHNPSLNTISMEERKDFPDKRPGVEEQQEVVLNVDRVQRALASIRDDYREVLVQYYINDLSLRQIAKIEELSATAVKTRLYRARQALRQEIDNREKRN
jgi:RNA polymerase sigma-70 factor (ECF subfamily)